LGVDLPCWLSEGIATLFGGFALEISPEFHVAESMFSDKLISLGKLFDKETFEKLVPIDAYSHSASFVKFLLYMCGLRKFKKLLIMVTKEPTRFSQIFEQIYGIPLTILEEQWKLFILQYLESHKDDIKKRRPFWSARRNIANKNYEVALTDIEEHLRLNSNDAYAIYLAGYCYFYHGNFEDACEKFSKAVSLPVLRKWQSRIYRESYLYLGKIHDLLGKRDIAIDYYNQVLKCPEYDNAQDEARKYLQTAYRLEDE
jgi:tetratricopeptide (TPR) repeat protein